MTLTRALVIARTCRRLNKKGYPASLIKALWVGHFNPHMSALWVAHRSGCVRFRAGLWVE
jgi:hypothetical protein